MGNHPPGIIQGIEAAESAGQHCHPLKDSDIITCFAEGSAHGTDYDAINKLCPGYTIPNDVSTITITYHCGIHERDIQENESDCTPQPNWEGLWVPFPGAKKTRGGDWTPLAPVPRPREPPPGHDWLARIRANAGEVLPPCCFPKGQGQATITIGSINVLSRAESSAWTNDGYCESIDDTAMRLSAASRAIMAIDAHSSSSREWTICSGLLL